MSGTHFRYTFPFVFPLHISVEPYSARKSFDIHSLHLGACERRYEGPPLFPRLFVGLFVNITDFFWI